MTITVTNAFSYPDHLAVMVDGFCNHLGDNEIVTEEFDQININGQDLTYFDDQEVCYKCLAHRPVQSDADWREAQDGYRL